MLTLEEKLKIIENSKSFDDLKNSGILPEPCVDEGYYFVSYAHSDFKRVIPEILKMQDAGVKIWYDRGLETGISWLKDVCRKIASYRCKGVIVYGSESFCSSPSCAKELEQIAKSKKSALLVELEMCAPEGLNALYTLASDTPVEDKIAALKSLPEPELFEFDLVYETARRAYAILLKVNDPNIKRAEIPAFAKIGGKNYPVRSIAGDAFSYCYNLYEVIIPDGWSIIFNSAFANCPSLQRVVLGRPYTRHPLNWRRHYGKVFSAFWNCTALKEIDFGSRASFVNECFKSCVSLQSATVDSEPSSGTFKGCTSLERVSFSKNIKSIPKQFFTGCKNLKEIHLPRSIKTVHVTAFEGAKSLKTVVIEGNIRFCGDGKPLTINGEQIPTGDGINHTIEEVFPYAEKLHIKNGISYELSQFKKLPDERKGFTTYGREL